MQRKEKRQLQFPVKQLLPSPLFHPSHLHTFPINQEYFRIASVILLQEWSHPKCFAKRTLTDLVPLSLLALTVCHTVFDHPIRTDFLKPVPLTVRVISLIKPPKRIAALSLIRLKSNGCNKIDSYKNIKVSFWKVTLDDWSIM